MALRFARLDRAAIRRLAGGEWKATEKGKRYWVGAKLVEHGIIAERMADGDLRYSVNVMVDGQRVHRVLGRESDGVTRTQAEEFIEKARTDARSDRLSLPKGRKLALTFAEAAGDYLTRSEEEGGKNLKIKRRQLRMYLKPEFGTTRLDAISGFMVERYKKQRRDQAPPRPRSIASWPPSHLLMKAVEWKWLDRLPSRPRKLAESAGRIIALDDDQCDALLAAAIAGAEPDLWLFVAFGLNTAMPQQRSWRPAGISSTCLGGGCSSRMEGWRA